MAFDLLAHELYDMDPSDRYSSWCVSDEGKPMTKGITPFLSTLPDNFAISPAYSRYDDSQNEDTKARRKTTLLNFGRILFIDLYPMWSRRVADEPFETFAEPTSKQLAFAKTFAEDPEVYFVHVGGNFFACKQYSDTGVPPVITLQET
jgi:hypothetical protein